MSEWINKLQYTHTMEYYTKQYKGTTDIHKSHYAKWKKVVSKGYDSIFMTFWKSQAIVEENISVITRC